MHHRAGGAVDVQVRLLDVRSSEASATGPEGGHASAGGSAMTREYDSIARFVSRPALGPFHHDRLEAGGSDMLSGISSASTITAKSGRRHERARATARCARVARAARERPRGEARPPAPRTGSPSARPARRGCRRPRAQPSARRADPPRRPSETGKGLRVRARLTVMPANMYGTVIAPISTPKRRPRSHVGRAW